MDEDKARRLLAGERERIERAIAKLARSDAQEHEGREEPGERGSESLYEDELQAGLAEDLAAQLAAIERAEARLAAGTYGVSIESGERIPDGRLEAMPTAERTLAEEERRGPGQ